MMPCQVHDQAVELVLTLPIRIPTTSTALYACYRLGLTGGLLGAARILRRLSVLYGVMPMNDNITSAASSPQACSFQIPINS